MTAALILGRDLARHRRCYVELDLSRVGDQLADLGRALDQHADLRVACYCARDLAEYLHHHLCTASNALPRDLEIIRYDELEYALINARDLARELVGVLTAASGLRMNTLDLARELARNLDGILAQVGHRAEALADVHRLEVLAEAGEKQSHELDPARRAVHITPTAGRLLAAVTRLLPATDCDRYGEEFRSELWEIASAGATRRRQIGYAVRQTVRIAQLRGSLLTPRRRHASL
jgi:hypothetical protein